METEAMIRYEPTAEELKAKREAEVRTALVRIRLRNLERALRGEIFPPN